MLNSESRTYDCPSIRTHLDESERPGCSEVVCEQYRPLAEKLTETRENTSGEES